MALEIIDVALFCLQHVIDHLTLLIPRHKLLQQPTKAVHISFHRAQFNERSVRPPRFVQIISILLLLKALCEHMGEDRVIQPRHGELWHVAEHRLEGVSVDICKSKIIDL